MKLEPWQNMFSVTVKANSIVQHVIQIRNGIIKHVNVNVEIIVRANKIILGILCICENSKYLKSNADTLLIECDEIISVMNIVSAKMTNSIIVTNATNLTKIVIVKR